MRKIKFLLTIALLLRIITFSYAWGKEGHHIIAEIAKSQISKSVQDSVDKYLNGMSWESASTWMDDIRNNPQYNYTHVWHYLDMEKGVQYSDTIANGNNVVKQLQVAIEHLKNRAKLSKEDINFNLKVLFHLMGDFHQPLHVGYGVDRGGNDIKVTFGDKKTNLHHIWDTDIIVYKNIALTNVQDILSKTSAQRLKKITDSNVIEWMNQTRKLLDAVYSYTDPIPDNYVDKSATIIEYQLLFAGVRLGKTLNDIFS